MCDTLHEGTYLLGCDITHDELDYALHQLAMATKPGPDAVSPDALTHLTSDVLLSA